MSELARQSFWLAIPVILSGILHMIVVKKDLFPSLNVPLDAGRSFRGSRIFGDNKTWRGVVFMVLCSAFLGAAQGWLGGSWAETTHWECLAFRDVGAWVGFEPGVFVAGYATVSAVLGLGYVLGELPNSFFKRRLALRPGETRRDLLGAVFLLVDQADSVIAALVLAGICFSIRWYVILVGIICLTLLHLAINALLYLVKVRKNF